MAELSVRIELGFAFVTAVSFPGFFRCTVFLHRRQLRELQGVLFLGTLDTFRNLPGLFWACALDQCCTKLGKPFSIVLVNTCLILEDHGRLLFRLGWRTLPLKFRELGIKCLHLTHCLFLFLRVFCALVLLQGYVVLGLNRLKSRLRGAGLG